MIDIFGLFEINFEHYFVTATLFLVLFVVLPLIIWLDYSENKD